MLTAQQVAKQLGVNVRTLQRLEKEGSLMPVNVAPLSSKRRTLRYDPAVVEAFLAGRLQQPAKVGRVRRRHRRKLRHL